MTAGYCTYCGVRMKRPNPKKHSSSERTTDHVFPRSGPEFKRFNHRQHMANKIPACRGCNGRKGDMHPTEWLQMIRDPVRYTSFAVIIENIVIRGCVAERTDV